MNRKVNEINELPTPPPRQCWVCVPPVIALKTRGPHEGLFPSLGKLCEASGCHKGNASTAISLAELPSEVVASFPSPNDLQFRWAKPLKDACAKDIEGVLTVAKSLADADKKLNPSAIFAAFTSSGDGPFYRRTPAAPVKVLIGKKIVATIGLGQKGNTEVHVGSRLDSVKTAELSEFLQRLLKE